MIKYTAHPEVIRKYESIRRNSKKPWDDHFQYATEICGSSRAYFACGDFWKHYFALDFFATVKRKEVPVNGVLISVDYFTETSVQ
jgi:hypothetical protein